MANFKEYDKQVILLDIDDTILDSSKQVINQLNKKNGTNYTIRDMKDYYYRDIDPGVTTEEIEEIYASQEFFDNVDFKPGFDEFMKKFGKTFKIVFVSMGTPENINHKWRLIEYLKYRFDIDEIEFEALNINQSKGSVYYENAYLCIDDYTERLLQYNCPKRILLKNNIDVDWNQVPVNRDDIYVANTWEDIIEMIDFDLKLKNNGIFLNEI